MEQIVTANVYCPFISQVNPLTEEARECAFSWFHQDFSWFRQMELLQIGKDLEQNLRHTYVVDYMAYLYPTARLDELVWLIRFLLWTFMLDFIADFLDEKPLAYARTILSQCASLLMVDPVGEHKPLRLLYPALALPLHDIWHEILPHTPVHWHQRFSQKLGDYITAHGNEIENRSRGVVPDLKSYRKLRDDTSMAGCLIDLVEYAERSFLPLSVVLSPEMQVLYEAASNHIIWVNDMFSRNRESSMNDPHNIITVLQHDEQCSLPKAVEKICQMISSMAKTVVEMGERLPTVFPDYADHLRQYVVCLEKLIAGNCSWHAISSRYDVAPPADTDETAPFYLVRPIVVAY